MARKSKPTMPLYVRLDPKLHDLLVGHMKRSGLSRAAIVEGALWKLFLSVDAITADALASDVAQWITAETQRVETSK